MTYQQHSPVEPEMFAEQMHDATEEPMPGAEQMHDGAEPSEEAPFTE